MKSTILHILYFVLLVLIIAYYEVQQHKVDAKHDAFEAKYEQVVAHYEKNEAKYEKIDAKYNSLQKEVSTHRCISETNLFLTGSYCV